MLKQPVLTRSQGLRGMSEGGTTAQSIPSFRLTASLRQRDRNAFFVGAPVLCNYAFACACPPGVQLVD